MFGVGGESPVETVRVDFRLGKSARTSWQLLVAGGQDLGGGIDVVLGEDFFHAAEVEFDLAHGVVRMFQARNCDGASLAYWANEGASEVAIEGVYDTRPQILVPVQVNGRPIEALLDSGAPFSILTKREAAMAGVTPDTPGVVAVGKRRGLGSRSVDTWIGPLDSFTIGNENIRDTAILFGDLFKDATYTDVGSHVPGRSRDCSKCCLGLDFLRSHRVLIAHSQRKLYFTYVGGPVFQPRGKLAAACCFGPRTRCAAEGGRRISYAASPRSGAARCLPVHCPPGVGWEGVPHRATPAAGDGAMVPSKSIQIILARQLASSIATPVLLLDAEGTLIYYNDRPRSSSISASTRPARCLPRVDGAHRRVDEDRNSISPRIAR